MYDSLLSKVIQQKLHPGDVFVDVGANNGFFSILASSIVENSGKVYSFEPTKATFARLVRNIEINNFSNIIPFNVALGNRKGKETFYDFGKLDGSNSFIGEKSAIPLTVEMEMLDNILGSIMPNIVKIDVEGFEREVLWGAKRTVLRNDDVILIFEYNRSLLRKKGEGYSEVINLLRSNGFKLYAMNDVKEEIETKEIRSHKDLNPWGCNIYASKHSYNG